MDFKQVPLANFRSGMCFEAPVFLEEDYILLSPEIAVSDELVTSLKRWGFSEVRTEGSPIGRVIGQDGKAGILKSAILDSDIKEQEGRRKAKIFYKEMVRFTEHFFERFKKDNSLNLTSVTDKVKETMAIIKENRQYVLRFSDFDDIKTDYQVSHAVKSTILALALGMETAPAGSIKIPPHKLIELGICALLHEIGMLRIPPQIWQKSEQLTDKERQLITAHPILGFNLLKTHTLPQDILFGVLQHHERNNGTGYPQKLQEAQISQFAKIVGVACSYVAQISTQPFREVKDGHTSMMDLLSNMQDKYDRGVINTLLHILSVYPIGSYVRLQNNCTGMVVNSNEVNPRHPVVKLLLDDQLAPFREQPLVNTGEYDDLHVKLVLSELDVKDLTDRGLLNP
jgi:HD-GYP domain-containing protein (c-di-GMP phosphodiesterase class II)